MVTGAAGYSGRNRRVRPLLDHRRTRCGTRHADSHVGVQVPRKPYSPGYADPGISVLLPGRDQFPVLAEHFYRPVDVRQPDYHHRNAGYAEPARHQGTVTRSIQGQLAPDHAVDTADDYSVHPGATHPRPPLGTDQRAARRHHRFVRQHVSGGDFKPDSQQRGRLPGRIQRRGSRAEQALLARPGHDQVQRLPLVADSAPAPAAIQSCLVPGLNRVHRDHGTQRRALGAGTGHANAAGQEQLHDHGLPADSFGKHQRPAALHHRIASRLPGRPGRRPGIPGAVPALSRKLQSANHRTGPGTGSSLRQAGGNHCTCPAHV